MEFPSRMTKPIVQPAFRNETIKVAEQVNWEKITPICQKPGVRQPKAEVTFNGRKFALPRLIYTNLENVNSRRMATTK